MNKTDLFGRVILTIAFVFMLVAAARAAFAGGGPPLHPDAVMRASAASAGPVTPREAIERAIAQRLGGDVSVSITALDTSVSAEPGLAALPEPGGRAGQPMRFVMTKGRVRRGVAVATVTVVGHYARASRPIARNEAIAAGAVEVVHGELPPIAFTRLPSSGDLVGLIARRDIARAEPLTEAVVQLPPLVRSGDVVTVSVTIGAVEISGKGTASGSGHEGDVIRVIPKPNGRPVKARITGRATVEIVQ